MSSFNVRAWLAALPLTALVACASALPPRDLVDARAEYAHAQTGPAAKFVPAELHVAAESLDAAEHKFSDDPKSQDAVDTAYIALRKIQRAEALGTAAAAGDAKLRAEHDVTKTQSEMLSENEKRLRDQHEKLHDTHEQLVKERESGDKARQETDRARQDTAAEHAARLEAERKAQDAMDALSKSLAMKKDDRGTIITLSGGVLFVTNKAEILPGAQAQLNQVAEALKTQAEHHFIVGGHTDDQGNDKINDDLSTRRANAVRDYLVVHGVAANAISAQGFGSHQPIGDNKSVEGRAMNRRVEIIVEKSQTSAQR